MGRTGGLPPLGAECSAASRGTVVPIAGPTECVENVLRGSIRTRSVSQKVVRRKSMERGKNLFHGEKGAFRFLFWFMFMA